MSTSHQTTDRSSANFTAIFDAAANEYKTLTKQDLGTHPLAAAFGNSSSPDSVLDVFRTQAQAFDNFRKGDDKLMEWLTPIVHILFTFSGTLDGIGLPFSPAKTLFTGIGVLLGAVKDVIASYEVLVKLFERIQSFLQRLNHYTAVTLTPDMTELLAKIMAQILSILALSTKTMKERQIKKIMKKIVGKTDDVEDAFKTMDVLTNEENLMTAARTLEVAQHVDDKITIVEEVLQDVNGNVRVAQELTHHVDRNVTATKEVISDIAGDVKENKSLAYHIDDNVTVIKELTCELRSDVDEIKGDTRSVNENIKVTKHVMEEMQRNHSRDQLRTWLSPPIPSINHNTACSTQHDGTAKWFIQGGAFDDWKKNGSLLWIRGNPGSGKSILCSAIIEDIKRMQESRSALIAYYYFDFRDVSKRDVRGLLASILLQLVDDSDRCWDLLSQLYKRCRDGSEQPSEVALAQCLKGMLDLPGQPPTYIIIDALDECPNTTGTPSARENVLNFVEDLVQSNHSNLFLCITSRPEQDIGTTLDLLTSQSRRVSLHEEVGQREDINNYVCSFVQNDKAIRRWRAEDRKLVISVLSERAQGMFRWAYCQLDNLRRCMPSSIRKSLDELPITLDETYERILEGIPKQKWEHAHRLFQCLVAAVRPLRVEELAEIFAIEFGSNVALSLVEDWRPEDPEEAVLSACSTLISIIVDDKGSKIVQFSHFSVKEYLTSDRLQTTYVENVRQYYIPLEPAHTLLAQACLTVLLQLDENVDKERVATLALAFYAAKHWVDHAKFQNVESQIQDAMEDLFDPMKPHFRAWVWMHNIGPWSKLPEFDECPSPRQPDFTPLYGAAICGFSGLAKHLIIAHAEDVNGKCCRGYTPLHAASLEGHVDVAQVLLEHGAHINAKDSNLTPLHMASFYGHPKVVQFLLEHKATVNARTRFGVSTPLLYASINGHLEVARLLLDHGADVNVPDIGYETPLEAATRIGHHDIARLMQDHGAR